MIYLKDEKVLNKIPASERVRTEYSVNEKTTLVNYGEDCKLVVSNEDFKRTVPCFLNLKGALDVTNGSLEKEKGIKDCNLTGASHLSDSWVLGFENGALIEVSQGVIDALKTNLGTKNIWKYSQIVEFLNENCA